MSDDTKYSAAEVEILRSLERVETVQNSFGDELKAHKIDDATDFKNLQESDKELLSKVAQLPEDLTKCGLKFQKEILAECDKRYVGDTEFKVLKTWLIAAITVGMTLSGAISALINNAVQIKTLTGG